MDRPDTQQPRVDIDLCQSGALAVMRFTGTMRGDDLDRAQRALAERLDGRTVSGLILDARASRPGYTAEQLRDAIEACLEIACPKRCAFVSGEAREDTLSRIESAGVPFAVRVRGFLDLEEGRRWAAGF